MGGGGSLGGGVGWLAMKYPHQKFPKVSGTKNSPAILGVGLPVYRSRIHVACLGVDSSVLGTWNVWWYLFKSTNLHTAGLKTTG